MSSKKEQRDKIENNVKSWLEILVPPTLHIFDVSIVEFLINARIFYAVSHDFGSVLFVLSLSMIFNRIIQKKSKPDSGKLHSVNSILMVSFVEI